MPSASLGRPRICAPARGGRARAPARLRQRRRRCGRVVVGRGAVDVEHLRPVRVRAGSGCARRAVRERGLALPLARDGGRGARRHRLCVCGRLAWACASLLRRGHRLAGAGVRSSSDEADAGAGEPAPPAKKARARPRKAPADAQPVAARAAAPVPRKGKSKAALANGAARTPAAGAHSDGTEVFDVDGVRSSSDDDAPAPPPPLPKRRGRPRKAAADEPVRPAAKGKRAGVAQLFATPRRARAGVGAHMRGRQSEEEGMEVFDVDAVRSSDED
jgi:hypothetical protein